MEDRKRVTLRLPLEINKKLEKASREIGISKNAYVSNLIFKDLARKYNNLKSEGGKQNERVTNF